MKILKTSLLPVALLFIGAGSAFATNLAKEGKKALVEGYVIRDDQPQPCQDANIECQEDGTVICTVDVGMGSEPVFKEGVTSCGNNLYFN